MHIAWCAPIAICGVGLSLFLSIPLSLALGEWVTADARVVIRLSLTTTGILALGALNGLALLGLAEFALSRSGLSLVRHLPAIAAVTVVMACSILAVWVLRSARLGPWLLSVGADLLGPGSIFPPWSATLWMLVGLGSGLVGCYCVLGPLDARDSKARLSSTSQTLRTVHGPKSIVTMDLLLWCRERQGMAMAVMGQVFWGLLCVVLSVESASAPNATAMRIDSSRFQEITRYMMPVGWAFFSTLSLGLIYQGGRQVIRAPIETIELVWSKFTAALIFSAVQWLLCIVCVGLTLGSAHVPPGVSVIVALFVLANACAFLAGVLVPVDKRRIHSGFGAILTSMLGIFTLSLCWAFVLGFSSAFFADSRARGTAQVVLCFFLVSLLITAASKAGKSYGLSR